MSLGPDAEDVRAYRRLLGYVRPYRWIIIPAVLGSAVYAGLTGVVPYFLEGLMEQLMTAVAEARDPYRLPALLAVVFALRLAADFLVVYGLSWVGRSVVRDLRRDLFAHYLVLPAAFYDASSTCDLIPAAHLQHRAGRRSHLGCDSRRAPRRPHDSRAHRSHDYLQCGVDVDRCRPRTAGCAARRRHDESVPTLQHAHPRLYGRCDTARGAGASGAPNRQGFRRASARAGAIRGGQPHEFSPQSTPRFDTRARRLVDAIRRHSRHRRDHLYRARRLAARRAHVARIHGIHHRPRFDVATAQAIDEHQLGSSARHHGRRKHFRDSRAAQGGDAGSVPMERARGYVEYRKVSFRYARGSEPVLDRIDLDVPAGSTVALVAVRAAANRRS